MKRLINFQEVPVHHVNNTWVSFDVTEPVEAILCSNENVFSIIITITAFFADIKDNLKISLLPEEENFEHDYPLLLLSYSSNSEETKEVKINSSDSKRIRRNAEEDYEEETNRLWDEEFSNKKPVMKKTKKIRNNCKRKPLYIDFAEISYDTWIVQPKGYEVSI